MKMRLASKYFIISTGTTMSMDIKIGFIGLDSSHSVEFIRRMQAPDCPADQKVGGMRATACLRFETPFQSKEGLDSRQKTLESWGVRVTTTFEQAVSDCDALLITINDPSLHLEYFRQCAALQKPVFMDKPLAENLASARMIADLVRASKVPFMSCSSLRHASALREACMAVPAPEQASTFGPLGRAPAGISIVWYGVHAFEMLQRAMGSGAQQIATVPTTKGTVCVVDYKDGRQGVVELVEGTWMYGGSIRGGGSASSFVVDSSSIYSLQLRDVEAFYRTGKSDVTLADALEVMAMLDAAHQSSVSGKPVRVHDES